MKKRWGAWLLVPVAALALTAGFSSAAMAQDNSTPGVTVTAQNPGAPGALRITMTAHSAASTVANPSCRPQDRNLDCWGDLVLQAPDGLRLEGLEVHRIAVGDISCGGEEGGGCGDEMTAAALDTPEQAQVNGLSTIAANPAGVTCPATNEPCPVGTTVQVKMTLTDNGPALYRDQISIAVNQFVTGPDKPLIWGTTDQTIQQVQIHYTTDSTE